MLSKKEREKINQIVVKEDGKIKRKAGIERIVSDEELAESIVRNKGVVSTISLETGLSTRVIKQRVLKNKALQEIMETIDDTALDAVEEKLLELAKYGDMDAIKFFLKGRGKERGYGDSLSIGGGKGNLSISFIPAEEQLKNVTPKAIE